MGRCRVSSSAAVEQQDKEHWASMARQLAQIKALHLVTDSQGEQKILIRKLFHYVATEALGTVRRRPGLAQVCAAKGRELQGTWSIWTAEEFGVLLKALDSLSD